MGCNLEFESLVLNIPYVLNTHIKTGGPWQRNKKQKVRCLLEIRVSRELNARVQYSDIETNIGLLGGLPLEIIVLNGLRIGSRQDHVSDRIVCTRPYSSEISIGAEVVAH